MPDTDPDTPNPSEAIYAFAAWLSSRKTVITIGYRCNADVLLPFIEIFCDANKFEKPRDNWPKNLVHPPDQIEGVEA